MSFSKVERLILSNQFRLLEKIDPSNKKSHSQSAEIVERGYEWLYSEIDQHFYDPMSAADGEEVVSVLELYRALDGFRRKGGKSTSHFFEFRGFDGNHEGEQFGFASYLIKDMGKWGELRDCELNSHRRVLDNYRRMLTAWDAMGRPYELDQAQVDSILP